MFPRVPIEPANPALGEAIRGIRVEQGLTQEEVAIDAGVTPGLLSRIERGYSNSSWTTVERLCVALGVSVADLAEAVEALS
jgi:transcriptional regulator with XRE-family HTH domain